MPVQLLDLDTSILAFEHAVRASSRRTRTFGEDPFHFDLPPLPSSGTSIDAETMSTMGGLYLIGQLGQAGMLRAGEVLIENRFSLDLRSLEAAELLDDAARDATGWLAAPDRDQLFARVFGLGAEASDQNISNDSFEQRLMETCSALNSWGDGAYFDRPPASNRSASLSSTVRSLRANLASRQHGNTLSAARRLAAQVRTIHEVLNHEGVVALAAGRSMWDVVRAMWERPPDIERFVTLGQSGQQILMWAGGPEADSAQPSRVALDSAWMWMSAMQSHEGLAA